MANIAHASLTGAEIHEPKGIENANLGEVYVADGNNSGSWANVGTSSFTGMIADFTWPVVQSGWLELDGSDINTTTYQALYDVMTIQMSGTRTNVSPIITSLSSTANMRVGYYVFGTGISSGTTILSIDSANQITMSGNASSTGTATVIVSPWLINTGTIRLPNLSLAGRYRRSRSATTSVGQLQADQNQAHTHSLSVAGTTSSDGAHTHTATVTDPGHVHTYNIVVGVAQAGGGGTNFSLAPTTGPTVANTTGITVANASNGAHTHTVTSTGTSGSSGATEARPSSIVVMTCVKT